MKPGWQVQAMALPTASSCVPSACALAPQLSHSKDDTSRKDAASQRGWTAMSNWAATSRSGTATNGIASFSTTLDMSEDSVQMENDGKGGWQRGRDR
eukprot:scaffold335_cov253-Pinguiococcus_pyrenoidosus.AAC.11